MLHSDATSLINNDGYLFKCSRTKQFLFFPFFRTGNSLSSRYFRERQNEPGFHHHRLHEQPKSGQYPPPPPPTTKPHFERGRQTQSSLDLNAADPVWKVSSLNSLVHPFIEPAAIKGLNVLVLVKESTLWYFELSIFSPEILVRNSLVTTASFSPYYSKNTEPNSLIVAKRLCPTF